MADIGQPPQVPNMADIEPIAGIGTHLSLLNKNSKNQSDPLLTPLTSVQMIPENEIPPQKKEVNVDLFGPLVKAEVGLLHLLAPLNVGRRWNYDSVALFHKCVDDLLQPRPSCHHWAMSSVPL